MRSKIAVHALIPFCALAMISVNARTARSQVTFYTSQTTFNASAGSIRLIDFEGIVSDTQFTPLTPKMVIGGVTFRTSVGMEGVAGKDSAVAGAPYNSALLFSNNAAPITADLSTAGSNITAVGGEFGNVLADAPGTLTLKLGSGNSLVENITASSLRQGSSPNFFGFTVVGDTISSVTLDTSAFGGIDNFVFSRTASSASSAVPEPSMLTVFFGSVLTGILFLRGRKFARNAA